MNAATAINLTSFTSQNVFDRILSANNTYGIRQQATTAFQNTFTHMSIVNSGTDGIEHSAAADKATYLNTMIANTGTRGVNVTSGATATKFYNFAVMNSGTSGINNSGGAISLLGFLAVGNNGTNCVLAGGSGMTNTTCNAAGTNGVAIAAAPSSAVLWTGKTAAASFNQGAGSPKATSDATYPSVTGVVAYNATTVKWFDLDNIFRTIGADPTAAAWPNANHRGAVAAGNMASVVPTPRRRPGPRRG
jgi:hypothetical protein